MYDPYTSYYDPYRANRGLYGRPAYPYYRSPNSYERYPWYYPSSVDLYGASNGHASPIEPSPPLPKYHHQQYGAQLPPPIYGMNAMYGRRAVGGAPSVMGYIIFSCIVFWLVNPLFGFFGFILALMGRSQQSRGFMKASLAVSVAGVIISLVVLLFLGLFGLLRVENIQ